MTNPTKPQQFRIKNTESGEYIEIAAQGDKAHAVTSPNGATALGHWETIQLPELPDELKVIVPKTKQSERILLSFIPIQQDNRKESHIYLLNTAASTLMKDLSNNEDLTQKTKYVLSTKLTVTAVTRENLEEFKIALDSGSDALMDLAVPAPEFHIDKQFYSDLKERTVLTLDGMPTLAPIRGLPVQGWAFEGGRLYTLPQQLVIGIEDNEPAVKFNTPIPNDKWEFEEIKD